MVYNQEPQLFYLASGSKFDGRSGRINFHTADRNEIANKWASMESVMNSLMATANQKGSTAEKLKVFHDYIVLNNAFAEEGGYNSSAYGGLCTGGLQCVGYAKAMQILCDKAGIYSMVVTGVGDEGATHAWNVVYCNGAYYNLDTTWDDPILDPVIKNNLRYRYFLVPDSWIHNITHFSVNERTLSNGSVIKYFTPPACTATAANYYTIYGKSASNQKDGENLLYNEILRAANAGMRVAEVRLTDKAAYEAMKGNLGTYAKWAKTADTTYKVTQVKGSTDDTMYVIEIDLYY